MLRVVGFLVCLRVCHSTNPRTSFHVAKTPGLATGVQLAGAGRSRRDMSSRVHDVVLSLALCHNVTPVHNEEEDVVNGEAITYQASSPDEVAIVKWTESVGLTLTFRDRTSIRLTTPSSSSSSTPSIITFDVLDIFPFTSESKRMGIVVRDTQTRELVFLQKGADVVMSPIVQRNDWLDEECANMAREGLRTLVIARKRLTDESYARFKERYHAASIQLEGRNEAMTNVVSEELEVNMELLGLTGVEDKLQDNVRSTLEMLRNAGLKIWMLTGDKIETATVIAISTKLVARGQYIHTVSKCKWKMNALTLILRPELGSDICWSSWTVKSKEDAQAELEFLQSKPDCCLVLDGVSLQVFCFPTEYSS